MSVQITAKMVGELRGATGAGLMDCKNALTEAAGDLEQAITILRKSGIASAEKKAGRATSEGLIEQYIHMGGKVGVLVEVNCETDFVAKTEDFGELVKDICLHIAAANPEFITPEEVPEKYLEKEREIAASQVQNKPPHIVQKIVEGKIEKIYESICLMEQPFVKDPDKTIKDLLTERIAKLGENINIRRFTRYQLGE
ncbi:MAG: Elongation factor Ts [Candidatus Moanabacter tarae]|uniref:Elongation factor Ts n=1 Tax=Candidatus Moanibacter tarae TaxID=2200854 RepID=A0A2Z4ACM5_9BACT|nr:MAG: Elongation factor Ts [Candidatus Moanabacter tarae]|tara:strand:+ start:2664 stop:3257 length:594 start_codon:yes stop_codon:yes gene_type:complete